MSDSINPSSQPLIDGGEKSSSMSSDDESNISSLVNRDAEMSSPSHISISSEKTKSTTQQETVPDTPPRTRASLSPKIQRSDSVKHLKSANGSAQRTGQHPIQNSTPPRPSKRVPSLKLKRMNPVVQTDKPEVMPCLSQGGNANPSITITIDSDEESLYSDYLSPTTNYHGDIKVQFVGDDTSLYGTPKEELLPSSLESNISDQKSSPTFFLREQIYSFFQPSDNKLAMKLFGNRNALIKEKMRHKRVGFWVIHPCSNFR